MNELILSNLKTAGSELGREALPHGGGFPAACLTTYVTQVGGVIETTILVDLAQGAGAAAGVNDVIGTDNVDTAGGAYIAQLDDNVNGVLFAARYSVIELPAGGGADIDVVCGSVGTNPHDVAVTDAVILINNGTNTLGESAFSSAGATIIAGGTNALPFVYLTNVDATNAAYTAGKLIITLYGARF